MERQWFVVLQVAYLKSDVITVKHNWPIGSIYGDKR